MAFLLEEVLADVESAEPGELLLVLVLVSEVGRLDLNLVARVLLAAVLNEANNVENIKSPCIAEMSVKVKDQFAFNNKREKVQ